MLRCRDIVRHGDAFLSGEMRGLRRADVDGGYVSGAKPR